MGTSEKRRLKVLISAYACEPQKGSEPAVGWNVVQQMAKYHDLWVLTRTNNREAIQKEIGDLPLPQIHFIYYDLPYWLTWWKRGARGIQLYYYFWQIGIFAKVKGLHKDLGFDLIHHVTLVKYWVPSFLSQMEVPFLWGPVGGGESSPKHFWCKFSLWEKLYESAREGTRYLAEHDPFVRRTAERSSMSLATTPETAERLVRIGSPRVKVMSQCGLNECEIKYLGSIPVLDTAPITFVSMGRLLHWKGFHLGLRAMARSQIHGAEYWIIGEGPERASMQRLAIALGIEQRVKFWGSLSRLETWKKLGEAHVLVHPSLHDSGGFVCLESMAARRPVICLATGGPGTCVTDKTGFKIDIADPNAVIYGISKAMEILADDSGLRRKLGEAGHDLIAAQYSWENKGRKLNSLYSEVTGSVVPGQTEEWK